MKLRFLGTSCFELESSGGTRALIDPYLTGNPEAAITSEDVTAVDLVLVTHGGFDHLGQAFEIVKRTGALLCASADVAIAARLAGIPDEQAFPMASGATRTHAGFRVQAVEARHVSITRLPDGFISGQPLGFVIWPEPDRPELAIYHGGDTSLFSDMKLIRELYVPTVGLIGLGGPEELPHDMNANEAAIAADWLGVRRAIPMHWVRGSGDPEAFRDAVTQRLPEVRVDLLEAGDVIVLDS